MAHSDAAAARPHVLVLGRAKTGTTFIAKSIEAASPVKPTRFAMEPKIQKDIENATIAATRSVVVMKILFDDWLTRRDTLDQLAAGTIGPDFQTRIAILRDPRDELISRIMYLPFGALLKGNANAKDVERWAKVLEQREANTALTFLSVYERYKEIFSGSETLADITQAIAKQSEDYAAYLKKHQGAYQILHYEDAVENNFSSIEAPLGWKVSTTDDLGQFSHTKRSGSSKNWMKWLHPTDIETIRPLMAPACDALGYQDWTLPPEIDRHIDPAHHSGYARSLVQKYHRQGGGMRRFLQTLKVRMFS